MESGRFLTALFSGTVHTKMQLAESHLSQVLSHVTVLVLLINTSLLSANLPSFLPCPSSYPSLSPHFFGLLGLEPQALSVQTFYHYATLLVPVCYSSYALFTLFACPKFQLKYTI